MANPVLGKSLCSHWFFLGQDFAVRTVSMETVQSVYFCFGAKPANSTSATKTAKKCENCHSSHWNYQLKLKRLKFFRNFKDGWRWTFFKCKPPEVHFTIRNRVPYNKLLTNRACSGRTGEYWPSVVFVQTSLRSVRTVTTSGQYSPVRPPRSVSKRLILFTSIPFFDVNVYHLSSTVKSSLIKSSLPLTQNRLTSINIYYTLHTTLHTPNVSFLSV